MTINEKTLFDKEYWRDVSLDRPDYQNCFIDAFTRDDGRPYVTVVDKIKNSFKTRKSKINIIDIEQAEKFRTSDTIFLLASGPSMLDITREQWEYINKHDSFGFNYAFLLDHVPTFFHQWMGKGTVGKTLFKRAFSSRREKYHDTVWLIFSNAHKRGQNPRYMPEFFPSDPTCWIYEYPKKINIYEDRPFNHDDFKDSIFYRGTLSLVLEIIYRLGYKNIVLMGVDLGGQKYFYDEFAEMGAYTFLVKEYYKTLDQKTHLTRLRKPHNYHPVDVYLYALNDLIFKPENINLYIGSKKSLLYPKLPLFEFDQ